MTSTNWLILLLFIFALCLCCSAMTNPPDSSVPTTYVDAYGNTYVTQTDSRDFQTDSRGRNPSASRDFQTDSRGRNPSASRDLQTDSRGRNPSASRDLQTGGVYYNYNWWNPFSWFGPSYGIGYDGIYPSYDSTYVDGNSRGWYNAGGWYGQTARPYYGYGRGYGRW